jgi:D-glycero-D-manno-heptose 1,7-bisphosphate phosphatase
VVTNQRGIAHGHMSNADLEEIHARMLVAVERAGGRIDAIYHCPHAGGCDCREPGPGMFERAARDLGIDLEASAVVGDRSSDMEAAARIGALRVLVADNEDPPPPADHTVADLEQAARWLRSSDS